MRSFQTIEFTTERLLQNGSKSTYIANASGVGHLRQLDDRTAQINSIQFGEGFNMYVDGNVDVIETDRITAGGRVYEVRGVKQDTLGSIDIKQLLLVRKKL